LDYIDGECVHYFTNNITKLIEYANKFEINIFELKDKKECSILFGYDDCNIFPAATDFLG
jgi:hypothetical protein